MRSALFSHALRGLVVLLVASATTLADEPAATPGLVKERPADGRFVETDRGFMVPYRATIPGTDVSFEMVPIAGGRFKMGSPAGEPGRRKDEGPRFEVIIEPFWMGKYEVTWAEYQPFMALYDSFKDFDAIRNKLAGDKKRQVLDALAGLDDLKKRVESQRDLPDAITAPTKLYDPSFTFEFGEKPRLPAATMTQYAARQYTKWLSRMAGRVYRLPSEAEWEYACRAGSTSAFHFGEDAGKLGEYAWYADNSDETTHEVGQKKPNPWGLYDVHGNVAEWVLDERSRDGYTRFAGKTLKRLDAVAWPTKEYFRVVRGGMWSDDAAGCRSAARLGSADEDWKEEDPNLPLSPWWYTNDPARGVGFRLLRPLNSPSKEELTKCWEIDVDSVRRDVADRLKEGRGTQGVVDPALPKAIKQLVPYKAKVK